MIIFWPDLVAFSTHEAQGFKDILFWLARRATLDGGQGFLHQNVTNFSLFLFLCHTKNKYTLQRKTFYFCGSSQNKQNKSVVATA